MTQPTAEAPGAREWLTTWERRAYDRGVDDGRRLEAERLAPLVEAAKAWRARFAHDVKDYKGLLLASEQDLVAAVDAFTQED